jgi:hypothetical protein
MRISESKLRRIIRSVISENMPYDNPDEYMGYGSYGEVEDSDVSLEELEKMLMSHSYEAQRADGYGEVIELQKKYKKCKDEYMDKLKSFINDVIEIDGRSSF